MRNLLWRSAVYYSHKGGGSVEPPTLPYYTFGVGQAPTATVVSGTTLVDADEGDTIEASRATWTRDGQAYPPKVGEVDAGWYVTDDSGTHLLQTETTLVVPAVTSQSTYVWRERLQATNMNNDPPEVVTESADVGPQDPPGATAVPSATPTAGQITVNDEFWFPSTQDTYFKVTFDVAAAIQDVAGVELQWTTDNNVPAQASKWEAMERVGAVWEMSYTNAESEPYTVFDANNPDRMQQLRFRVRYPGDLWSAESPNVDVTAPAPLVDPGPPGVTANRVWFGHMMNDASTASDPALRGLAGVPFQYMYGMDVSIEDDDYAAIIEDVAGVWRSLGKDPQGRYTWEMSPVRGLNGRGGNAMASCPTDKTLWLWSMSSDSPGSENPGIFKTTDYFETAHRVLNPGRIPGGGGSQKIWHYAPDNLKFAFDGQRVYFINSNSSAGSGGGTRSTGGVWMSDDQGDTWSQRCNAAEVTKFGLTIWGIDIHPSDRTYLVGYGKNGVFVSSNSGSSWSAPANNGLPSGLVTSLQINPQNASHWRCCRYGRGIYETTNSGANWSLVNIPISMTDGHYGKVESSKAPGYFDRYMVLGNNTGFSGGPKSSTMVKGAQATRIEPDGDSLGNESIISGWHLQIRCKGGSEASNPQAKTMFRWSHQNPNLVVGHSRCTFWQNTGADGNLADFKNAGIGYNGAGYGQNNIGCLYEVPDGSVMAVSLFDYGVMVSTDYGVSWSKRGANYNSSGNGGNFATAIDPSGSGAMIVITGKYQNNRICGRSGNYGVSWSTNFGEAYQQFRCVGWNDNDTNYCYNDKYFSRDRGQNWVRWNANGGVPWGYANTNTAKFLAVSRANGRVVWARDNTGREIWRGVLNPAQANTSNEWSWNLAHTLPTAQNEPEFATFWPDPNDEDVFFYYHNGLRRVDWNGGSPNMTTHGSIDLDGKTPTHIRTDPNNSDIVYLFARTNYSTQIAGNADIMGTPNAWENLTENLYASAANSCLEVLSTGEIVVGGTGGPYIRRGLGTTNSRIDPGGSWENFIQPRAVYIADAGGEDSGSDGGGPDPDPDPDLEDGLTPTDTFAVGALLSSNANTQRTEPVVFAADFTGLDGDDAGGFLYEQGGGGNGCYVGFRANGDFVVRSGSGQAVPQTGAATIVISGVSKPSGDGTLIWAFDGIGTALRARVWWNGTLLGTDTSTYTGNWTGGDGGGYLANASGSATELIGEYYPGTDPTYTTASGLRYYRNTTLPG